MSRASDGLTQEMLESCRARMRLTEPGRIYPYSRWWCFWRWYHRRKIKIGYPSFWNAVVRKQAW